ncbi:hypothetical protein CLOSTMETH_03485 [[Clostridium] methylpentosum DSM 5476]|uniref:Uncharacterized protein n=1 Tax=[Clostridium] methylpentosum DSM 5476 TaxID=537013 RepID=C0EHZ0_9FIRM|nr:hypothetical protein CLOSTMETH_03485 [[Clostridium] methylpentosum DSM 5476]
MVSSFLFLLNREPNPSAPSRGKGNGSKEYISPSLDYYKHNRERLSRASSP